MWTFEQKTGKLLHDGASVGVGYSGHGEGKCNPERERERGVGPIPRGFWAIGPAHFSDTKGPVVMRLTPLSGTETYGRSGFLIHGDSIHVPGTASLGCIVLPRALRLAIAESGDTDLEVVSGEAAVNVA
jgi:hypothetical protein